MKIEGTELDNLFDEASASWEAGETEKAFNLFYKAAMLGHGGAQHNVGYFYDVGIFVPKKILSAVLWYIRAFETDGQTSSCLNIAKICSDNSDFENAIYWWGIAMKNGDGEAALELAQHLILHGDQYSGLDLQNLLTIALESKQVTESSKVAAAKMLSDLRKKKP